ncbi:uncharacterized protein LOC123686385 [Harmonia axyridis]|uniref:uncharacterized protein LOC123686385 n=1 Tax=Harmonia axyridis TaxID=115357 RepID=UPI001E278C40|nr:uncharacterized protein LOC123686385 [Harmonia axyridis]
MDKCFKVTYTRKSTPLSYGYHIAERFLSNKDEICDLGVLFDSSFSFIPHVDQLCASASRALGFVFRCSSEFRDWSILRNLYFALVVSKLEYAHLVWFPIYDCHLSRLERVHRRFFKYVLFKRTGRYPERGADLSDVMEELRISSLLDRHEEQCARFARGLLANRIDSPYLLSKMSFNVPRLAARSTPVFYLPTARTNISERSPVNRICKSANKLRVNVFG